MITTRERPAAAPALEALNAPLHIGAVTLAVRDLPALTAFYRDGIGLTLIEASATQSVLGSDGEPLVRLLARPEAKPAAEGAAGLFHLAILLPTRADLGRWLAHAARFGVHLDGASDHLVSEALYLSDPEGNGIEIYRDRPRADWPHRDGALKMATERLDLNALLREAGEAPHAGLPPGTRMGHIHLRVGDTAEAERFYGTALELDLTVRYPGASFLSSGGYHHHVAGNVWSSRGAGSRPEGGLGLVSFEMVAADAETLAKAEVAALAAGGTRRDGQVTIDDPWGNRVLLR